MEQPGDRLAKTGYGLRHICFFSGAVASLFDPSAPPCHGGAELQMFQLAVTLQRRPGYDVHFITDSSLPEGVDSHGLTLHVLPKPVVHGIPGLSVLENLRRWYVVMRQTGCDVFVQSSQGGPTGQMALVSKLLGARFVYYAASDADVDGSLLEDRPRVRRLFFWGLEHADVVFSQNRFQQEKLRERHGVRSAILRNGFKVPTNYPERHREHILWVSSVQRLKRPELFIRLAQRMPEERFVMVAPPRERTYFDEIVTAAATVPNLELIPGVSLDGIDRYYERAKLFVNTSEFEGFPNAFVQAAMAGTPIVSLDVDPDGLLSSKTLGVYAHGDLGELETAVRSLCMLDARWCRLSQTAFDYARGSHDIETVVDTLTNAIWPIDRLAELVVD